MGGVELPGTHCLRMLSYPSISGALETSGYYAAISFRLSSYYRSLHAYNWCFEKSLLKNEAKPVMMAFRHVDA